MFTIIGNLPHVSPPQPGLIVLLYRLIRFLVLRLKE